MTRRVVPLAPTSGLQQGGRQGHATDPSTGGADGGVLPDSTDEHVYFRWLDGSESAVPGPDSGRLRGGPSSGATPAS